MMRLGIGMRNAEEDIFKPKLDINEKDIQDQKIAIKNPILRKLDQGVRDEKFVKDYYEILLKSDKFLRNSTKEEIERASAKYGMNLGKKDRWGRRYEHFGFFDEKNKKNYGKTLGEVIKQEAYERATKDDDNAIEFMFSNIPTDVGFIENNYIVEDEKYGFRELNPYEKAKKFKPRMIVIRDNKDCINKIEMLTEYLHIRRIDDELKILEFFIPAKFRVGNCDVEGEIFKEIININSVWIKDEYDNKFGFSITGFYKTTKILNENIKEPKEKTVYDVIKVYGKIIENYK